jgi:hypothetical protein
VSIKTPEFLEYFLGVSDIITGFSRSDMEGSGKVELYFDTVLNECGEEALAELLKYYRFLATTAERKYDPMLLLVPIKNLAHTSACTRIIELWNSETKPHWDKDRQRWIVDDFGKPREATDEEIEDMGSRRHHDDCQCPSCVEAWETTPHWDKDRQRWIVDDFGKHREATDEEIQGMDSRPHRVDCQCPLHMPQ